MPLLEAAREEAIVMLPCGDAYTVSAVAGVIPVGVGCVSLSRVLTCVSQG